MPKLSLNKSQLHKKQQQLKLYQKLLPSLELKRQQLMAEHLKAQKELAEAENKYHDFVQKTGKEIPMLANEKIDHSQLCRLKEVEIGTENIVGIRLPVLENTVFEMQSYAIIGKPPWSEMYIRRFQEGVRLDLERAVLQKRIVLLQAALKKTTQRVNLFEKVLIPETRETIKRIYILLDDAQRASVVRSKIAKAKQREAH